MDELTPAERIAAHLDAYSQFRGPMHPELISVLGVDGKQLELRVSDIRAVLAERDDLQRRLDARAVDLGRLTQTNVDRTKELEAERNAAYAVIRRLAGFGDNAYVIDRRDSAPDRMAWRSWGSRTHFDEMTEPEREAIERARRR